MRWELYRAINEDFTAVFKTLDRGNEPLFHIVSGTSISAINVVLLVSYVKENKTWEGLARLIEFWEYLSTQPLIENIPYFMDYWDYWHRLNMDALLQGSLQEDILPLRNLF